MFESLSLSKEVHIKALLPYKNESRTFYKKVTVCVRLFSTGDHPLGPIELKFCMVHHIYLGGL